MNLISEIDGFEYIRCSHCERIAGGITPAQKAAPDLLEACEKALFLLEEGDDMFEGNQEAAAYGSKVKQQLQAAIRKARGE